MSFTSELNQNLHHSRCSASNEEVLFRSELFLSAGRNRVELKTEREDVDQNGSASV